MHWSDKVKNDALAVSIDAMIAFDVNKKTTLSGCW